MSLECKVCRSTALRLVAHTAECRGCGVLLNYPYLDDATLRAEVSAPRTTAQYEGWYASAATRNHDNFTRMLRFAIGDLPTLTPLAVLDYGGGGGQFACVVKSLFPNATVWLTDAADTALLPQWRPFNHQIPFADFPTHPQQYDAIFLNDVFEHVNDPVGVLRLLATKLRPGGRVFIDTPRPSWLYPLLRRLAPRLHVRLLRGTVDTDHLQLWARRAFQVAVARAGLRVHRYTELTEFTREADYYLRGIGVSHPGLRLAGRVFHRAAPHLRAHNKLMAVLVPPHANCVS